MSPQIAIVNPVDDEHMEDEQGSSRAPPAARTFLERHRPAASGLDRADRDIGEDQEDDDGDADNEFNEQLETDGDLRVEVPEVSGDHNVAINADPEVLVPPAQLFAPRPRAKGVGHPPVPTRAQIDNHALEQHVNYASWPALLAGKCAHEEAPHCHW